MDWILHAFTKIFESFLYSAQAINEWLMKPWFTWGDFEATPMLLFTFTGLCIVAAVMLIKFLNPAS